MPRFNGLTCLKRDSWLAGIPVAQDKSVADENGPETCQRMTAFGFSADRGNERRFWHIDESAKIAAIQACGDIEGGRIIPLFGLYPRGKQ